MPFSESPPLRVPEIDPAAKLLFVINAASGHHDADMTRQVIETALLAAERTGELLFAPPWRIGTRRTAGRLERHRAALGGDCGGG